MAYPALISESGDVFAASDLDWKWLENVGSVSLVAGRTNNAIRFSGGGSYLAGFYGLAGSGSDRWTASRAIRVSAFGSGYVVLARWYEQLTYGGAITPIQELRLYADGSLAFYKGSTLIAATAAGVFGFGSFVWLDDQFTLYDAGGSATQAVQGIRVGGSVVLNYAAAADNKENAVNFANYCRWGNVEADGNTVDVDIDDALWAHAGVVLGDQDPPAYPAKWYRVAVERPSGAGNSTQLAVTGAAANYQAVNETTPDGDTSYVSTSTVGQVDTYAFSPNVPGTLESVIHHVTHRWESAPGSDVGLGRLRYTNDAAVTTNHDQAASQGTHTAYLTSYRARDVTPSSEAWNNTRLARAEFGGGKLQAGGTTVRITAVFLEVLYWTAAKQRSRAYLLA